MFLRKLQIENRMNASNKQLARKLRPKGGERLTCPRVHEGGRTQGLAHRWVFVPFCHYPLPTVNSLLLSL